MITYNKQDNVDLYTKMQIVVHVLLIPGVIKLSYLNLLK